MQPKSYLEVLYPFLNKMRVLQTVKVLRLPLDHLKAFQNVYYVIDSSPLDTKWLQAVLKIDSALLIRSSKVVEELKAQFSKGFLRS
jgi:hypothetical protein